MTAFPKGETRKTRTGREHRHDRPRLKICANTKCGREFEQGRAWRKYCSAACCYQANRSPLNDKVIVATCAKCGAEVRRRRTSRKRKAVFCSHACSRAYHVGAKSSVWRGGKSSSRGPGWPKTAERVRQRDGYKCRWCGKSQQENGERLSVDHVRPWREFEHASEANDDTNLVSLCKSCHGKKLRLEHRWLKGDYLALQEYKRMVGITSQSLPLFDRPLPADAKKLGPPPPSETERLQTELARRQKIGAAHKGKKRRKEWGLAISEAKKTYYADPENRARQNEISRATAATPEWRIKQREGTKTAMARPEVRAKHLDGIARHARRKAERDGKVWVEPE